MNQFRTSLLERPEFTGKTAEKPEDLWSIDEAPTRLFLRGSSKARALLEKLPEKGFAVVGTRAPQARSLMLVRNAIQELGKTTDPQLIIISGLALGVDSAAHEAALDASLPTIAILGGGLGRIYPYENSSLAERILASDGLLVSEYPDDVTPRPNYFLRRNRLIAGWSRAVWIVEAGHRSGALNTARWARDMGRETLVTPCFPGDPAYSGNQKLLDSDHAHSFWSTHNLGVAWLSLSARAKPRREGQACNDQEKILKRVFALTCEKGGATADELLQWALSASWDPQRFFLALQDGITTGQILERQGHFSAIGDRFTS